MRARTLPLVALALWAIHWPAPRPLERLPPEAGDK